MRLADTSSLQTTSRRKDLRLYLHRKTERVSASTTTAKRLMVPSPTTARCLVVMAMLVLLTSPTDAYFMKCKQLCSMLAREELQQVLCIYNICRNEKLGKHILRYAKRSARLSPLPSTDSLLNDVPSTTRRQDAVLANLELAGEKGLKERNTFLRMIMKAQEELGGRRVLPPVEEKRDIEYWDGPSPAEINA